MKVIDFDKFSSLARHLLELEFKIVFTGRSQYYMGRSNGKQQALKEIEELKKTLKGACIKGIIIDEVDNNGYNKE